MRRAEIEGCKVYFGNVQKVNQYWSFRSFWHVTYPARFIAWIAKFKWELWGGVL